MITNEEARKAIEKYQKEHPLPFGTMIDVTAISSEEGVDIISQTIEKISKKVEEDTELWCICEMAKMYMQGVKPVYPVRPHGEWEKYGDIVQAYDISGIKTWGQKRRCTNCGLIKMYIEDFGFYSFCPNCGAQMSKEGDK